MSSRSGVECLVHGHLDLGIQMSVYYVASSPGHSQFFNVARYIERWEWPGDEAMYYVCCTLHHLINIIVRK